MQKSYSPGRVGIACFLLAALAAGANAVTIKGTITDAARRPLAGMVAAAYSPAGFPQATATSDSQGQYVLTVPAGRYRVLAYDNNGTYATEFGEHADSFDTSPVVIVTSNVNGVDFVMQKAGTVTGTVTAGGTPLAQITVAAYNVTDGTRRDFTRTRPDGTYQLLLPPGDYKLAAYDDGGLYAVSFFQNQNTFVSATTLSVAVGQPLVDTNFQLSRSAHLSGTVVDADTHSVLSGQTVVAYAPEGTVAVATTSTDAAGNFTLTVPPGAYKLVAADPAHIYATGYVADSISFAADPTITLAPGASVGSNTIPLHRAGGVSGRVTDAGGNALAGMTVAAYNADGSQRAVTTTDSTGGYTLLLPPGDFRIAAYDPGVVFATQFYPQHTLFADAAPVTVTAAQLTAPVNFALNAGARFTGTITDQATGATIAGISVGAYDDNGNLMNVATTDTAGNYTLVVPEGHYRLAAFDNVLRYITGYGGGAPNYDTAFVYNADGTAMQRVDFSLARGVRVTGSVIDSGSAFVPVSGVQIAALDPNGDRIATATAHDGTFDLVLAPGTYKLLAVDPRGRFYAMFFPNAWTLDTAQTITVTAYIAPPPIQISLIRFSRRRTVRH